MVRLSWILLTACHLGAEAAPQRSESALGLPHEALPDGFWELWGDGRAELSGYRLKTPRYGQVREGRATLVFVTERFTHAQRVKSDGGHPDEYPVLKVNEVRDFQTGLYDYNVMTSTFHRLDDEGRIGAPVKVSMSMQEWCGHVYEQLVPTSESLTWTAHSYFDGEADRTLDLDGPAEGVVLDSLPAIVRGLLGPVLERGESLKATALPTLVHGRLVHRTPSWTSLSLSRAPKTTSITVPAGSFTVDVYTSDVPGMYRTDWYVEAAWPHRIVKWETDHGEVAELLGSDRQSYWNQHGNGDEARLPEVLGHPVPTSPW